MIQSDLYHPLHGLYRSGELNRIKKFLQSELDRSYRTLKTIDPPACFLSYLFRNRRTEMVSFRLGGIQDHRIDTRNTVYADIRVGSYAYDNVTRGGLSDNVENEDAPELEVMPAEVSEDAYRFALWKLTDSRYRDSTQEYFNRKSRELHFVDPNGNLPARIKRKPTISWKIKKFENPDLENWTRILKKASALVKNHTRIQNSGFEIVCHHEQSIYVDTEGSLQYRQSSIWELRGFVWMLSREGESLSQEMNLLETSPESLPSEKELLERVRNLIERLFLLEEAETLNSYSGPVLLSPMASALFFHEVIGHRLEGSRLLSPDEGSTFRDLREKKIAPDYIDIIDDPTCRKFAGRGLLGSFAFDDEGTPAKSVKLVDRGILKTFLSTRAPLPEQNESNGHARNQKSERPISRMGNLFIVNHRPITEEDIWNLFLKEIQNQKKQFGIYILETLGGETDTGSYDFQAFKGEILYAVKVFPDGTVTPVRGVDFVGTPLSALDAVIGMGDSRELDNSYCGAESGMVPVSTIAPSLLLKTLELQSGDRERYTPYFLPPPYGTRK